MEDTVHRWSKIKLRDRCSPTERSSAIFRLARLRFIGTYYLLVVLLVLVVLVLLLVLVVLVLLLVLVVLQATTASSSTT